MAYVFGVPAPSMSHMAVTTYHSVSDVAGYVNEPDIAAGRAAKVPGLVLGAPALVAYPNMTGPSTCSGSTDQPSAGTVHVAQAPPHPVKRFPLGVACGYHEERVPEMSAYCCVSL